MELPNDLLAEKLIISACISSIDALTECIDALEADMFYDNKNSIIFESCKRIYLNNKAVDHYAVIAELGASLDSNDAAMILDTRDYHNPNIELDGYLDSIIEKSNLRKLYVISLGMSDDSSKNTMDSSSIIEKYVKKCTDVISSKSSGYSHIEEIKSNFKDGKSFLESFQERVTRVKEGKSPFQGVKSYFPRLDESIGSFRDGCLHYIGARTSMGKTTFLLNLIMNIMKNEPETGIALISLEMDEATIVEKMLCIKACVQFSSYSNMRFKEDEIERIVAVESMLKGNLVIDDSATHISMLCARARRMVNVDGVKIIFIDYLTFIKASGGHNSNHEKVNEVSKGLQRLAKELKIPIVCLAQLNRSLTARVDKTPTLSDFRESGSIEEDADVCMLLHRPAYYDQDSEDKTTHLFIAKNRLLGEIRKIKYDWKESQPGMYFEQESFEEVPVAEVSTYKSDKKEDNRYDPNARRGW